MKTSIARIRLYLKSGKVLSDGTSPIMLMCSFNGRKEVSTGCSCIIKYWDKKGECVKKGYPNWLMLNVMIKKMKDDAIAVRDEYERLGQPYTPEMVLSPRRSLSAVDGRLKCVIERYLAERGLSYRTVEKWWVVYRSVREFCGRELSVAEIDENLCRSYCRWLTGNGLSSGSVRSYMSKVVCLLHYAVSVGLIGKYPLDGWKYHKEYRECKSELYIHHRSMDVMMEMFINIILERHGERYRYREGVVEGLLDIRSELYGIYLYLVGYYMKGLAPVDISLLKKSDIKVMMLKDIMCYAVDGVRSKTGMIYKIRLRQDCEESIALIRVMLLFNEGEYFLPTLNGFEGNVRKRVNNLYTSHTKHLLAWFRRVNEEIVRRNVEEGDNIPLIDMDCRYYSYRHSYIMAELQKENVNLLRIAQSVGKSPQTLHQYISLLGDVDLL